MLLSPIVQILEVKWVTLWGSWNNINLSCLQADLHHISHRFLSWVFLKIMTDHKFSFLCFFFHVLHNSVTPPHKVRHLVLTYLFISCIVFSQRLVVLTLGGFCLGDRIRCMLREKLLLCLLMLMSSICQRLLGEPCLLPQSQGEKAPCVCSSMR